MTINAFTPLREFTFHSAIGEFWDNQLIPKFTQRYDGYSAFTRDKKFPEWEEFVEEKNIYHLIESLTRFNSLEGFDFRYNNQDDTNPSTYLSLQMLELLSKNELALTDILYDHYTGEQKDDQGWNKRDVFNMYFLYLDSKNEFIPDVLENVFISYIHDSKQYHSYIDLNGDINSFFQFLKVVHPKKITYEFFSEHLHLFCLKEDEDSGELENHCKILDYDSQKKIYDYVCQYFPEHTDDNKQYYEPLLPKPIFSSKRLYQGSIDIDIFQLIHQFNLQQKDYEHLCNIAEHCLDVVSSKAFMDIIHEDIDVSNINKVKSQKSITLNFSTGSYEELEKFESILFSALKGVLPESKIIKLRWSEAFSGPDELITNMDANFVYKYYSFHSLDAALDNNKSTKRQNKI